MFRVRSLPCIDRTNLESHLIRVSTEPVNSNLDALRYRATASRDSLSADGWQPVAVRTERLVHPQYFFELPATDVAEQDAGADDRVDVPVTARRAGRSRSPAGPLEIDGLFKITGCAIHTS